MIKVWLRRNWSVHLKNNRFTNTKTGIKMIVDHSIYPKNDGILMLFSSAMALTMKLGPFPM